MLISHSHKLIFFANRKCGSTSVKRAMDQTGGISWDNTIDYNHCGLQRAERKFGRWGWDFDAYTKVTTIRNPWSRVKSFYTFGKYGNGNIWQAQYKKYPEFNDFVFALPAFVQNTLWYPLPETKRVGDTEMKFSMSIDAFGTNAAGEMAMDYVVPMEDLKEQFEALMRSLGVTLKVGHYHKSEDFAAKFKKSYEEPNDYRLMYSEKSANIVSEIFSADIELGNYRFE